MKEVLGAPCLAAARVLAGAGGLDRVVSRLNVMEVPDILPWVKPHELLLTTGYPLRDDPAALVRLVGELDDRGLAALAIKLYRYIDELPAELLAEADRRDFPILEYPQGVGFDDVLNEVIELLLDRQAAMASRSEEVHRALVSVVLEGGDLSDLVQELARLLDGPVLVTTPDGRVIAQAGDRDELAEAAVVPIVAARVDHGRIVFFSRTGVVSAADMQCLERAATVAALLVTKGLAVAAVEGKYRADFLRDLLTGRVDDLAAAVAHASSLGWNIDRPMVAVVAEADPGHVPRLATAWQTALRRVDPAAPVASFHTEVVALVEAGQDAVLDPDVFSLGVSRVAADLHALPRAYEQARTAVRIGRRLHGPGARASFDGLGAYRLLALIPDSAELQGYVVDVLGELADPQADDLRHTLEVLIDTNGNVAEAARQLHFHYNTLRYRIEKLERLVGPFTRDPALRLDLCLALRVLQMSGSGR